MSTAESGPEFAAYSERDPSTVALVVTVRGATRHDVPAVTRLHAARNRLDPHEVLPAIQADVEAMTRGDETRHCFVAVHAGEVVGYGRTRWTDPTADPAARNVPAGWYLTGVVVHLAHRRRGIGLALTRRRLERLGRLGATEAWYVANARNRVSIALHDRLGFEEVTRDFTLPGVTFRGGEGALYRRILAAATSA